MTAQYNMKLTEISILLCFDNQGLVTRPARLSALCTCRGDPAVRAGGARLQLGHAPQRRQQRIL